MRARHQHDECDRVSAATALPVMSLGLRSSNPSEGYDEMGPSACVVFFRSPGNSTMGPVDHPERYHDTGDHPPAMRSSPPSGLRE